MVVDGIAKFQAQKFTFQGLKFPVKSLVLLVRRRNPQKFQAQKFQNSGPEIWNFHPPPFHTPPFACLGENCFRRCCGKSGCSGKCSRGCSGKSGCSRKCSRGCSSRAELSRRAPLGALSRAPRFPAAPSGALSGAPRFPTAPSEALSRALPGNSCLAPLWLAVRIVIVLETPYGVVIHYPGVFVG